MFNKLTLTLDGYGFEPNRYVRRAADAAAINRYLAGGGTIHRFA